jgi:hypothetical protein
LERQAADNKASIEYRALKNKESLAKQMTEQHCEIKELTRQVSCDLQQKIDQRANETNQLIRKLDTNRIRDSLNTTSTENLILRLKCGHGILPQSS